MEEIPSAHISNGECGEIPQLFRNGDLEFKEVRMPALLWWSHPVRETPDEP